MAGQEPKAEIKPPSLNREIREKGREFNCHKRAQKNAKEKGKS
jgi:hypothetical protein